MIQSCKFEHLKHPKPKAVVPKSFIIYDTFDEVIMLKTWRTQFVLLKDFLLHWWLTIKHYKPTIHQSLPHAYCAMFFLRRSEPSWNPAISPKWVILVSWGLSSNDKFFLGSRLIGGIVGSNLLLDLLDFFGSNWATIGWLDVSETATWSTLSSADSDFDLHLRCSPVGWWVLHGWRTDLGVSVRPACHNHSWTSKTEGF